MVPAIDTSHVVIFIRIGIVISFVNVGKHNCLSYALCDISIGMFVLCVHRMGILICFVHVGMGMHTCVLGVC
jgi:hypothetical protein